MGAFQGVVTNMRAQVGGNEVVSYLQPDRDANLIPLEKVHMKIPSLTTF